MDKIKTIRAQMYPPADSDFSLTPRSVQTYDFKDRKTLGGGSAPAHAGAPAAGGHGRGGLGGGNPGMHNGLDVRDMLVSPYDQRANVNIWHVVVGAGVGLGIGVLLAQYNVNDAAASWIALPGDLFIQALKCLVTPMVFCSVVCCMGELVEAGKAASIGGRMVACFALAAIVSSTVGTTFGYIMNELYPSEAEVAASSSATEFTFRCANDKYLMVNQNTGALACAGTNATSELAYFTLNDTSGYFTTEDSTEYQSLDVSDQIISILEDLVPENIVESFAGTSTLSIIAFAIWFGVAVVKSHDKNAGVENYALLMVQQANTVVLLLVNIVVKYIPFAIVSLIAGSMASYGSSTVLAEGVAFLIGTLFVALCTLVLGIFGIALFVTTRRSIFSYLRHIVPAQIFIIGCSSSIATLPMTMRCVDSTREVSYALSRFILPLGATSNLNGTACYLPLACIFLAKVGGYDDLLTPVRFVLLAVVSAIGSFGVAGVPHAGLVMVLTIWRTVFSSDIPAAFTILVSVDWIMDRLRSVVNITNDTIIVRIIAEQCDEAVSRELEGAHEEYYGQQGFRPSE